MSARKRILSFVKNAREVFEGTKPPHTLGVLGHDTQVVVFLEHPSSSFLESLALGDVPIIKKSAFQKHGDKLFERKHFPCSGPYMLESCNKEFRIRLVSNPYYYDKQSLGGIEQINFCVDRIKQCPIQFNSSIKDVLFYEHGVYHPMFSPDFVTHIKGLSGHWLYRSINIWLDRKKALHKRTNRKSITVILSSEIRTLNPFALADSRSTSVMLNLHEGLVKVNQRGEIVPALAKSWKVTDDGLMLHV